MPMLHSWRILPIPTQEAVYLEDIRSSVSCTKNCDIEVILYLTLYIFENTRINYFGKSDTV